MTKMCFTRIRSYIHLMLSPNTMYICSVSLLIISWTTIFNKLNAVGKNWSNSLNEKLTKTTTCNINIIYILHTQCFRFQGKLTSTCIKSFCIRSSKPTALILSNAWTKTTNCESEVPLELFIHLRLKHFLIFYSGK